jgi:hypothetical protein
MIAATGTGYSSFAKNLIARTSSTDAAHALLQIFELDGDHRPRDQSGHAVGDRGGREYAV